MRIAIGAIMQETNSFCPIKADIDDFRFSPLLPLLEDNAIVEAHRGINSEIGGFIEVCEANKIEIVPMIAICRSVRQCDCESVLLAPGDVAREAPAGGRCRWCAAGLARLDDS